MQINKQFMWNFKFNFSPFAVYITSLCLRFVKSVFINSEYLFGKTLQTEFSYSKEVIESFESLSEALKDTHREKAP